MQDIESNRSDDMSRLPNGEGKSSVVERSMNDLPIHTSVAEDAGPLWKEEICDDPSLCTVIPHKGRSRKKVLVLCTGGTLTMQNDVTKGNSLAPVQGALTSYLAGMSELTSDPEMPEIISHEYSPLIDSSDMGPGDWAMLARDINTNYYYFDGFVIVMGTDTMAYAASALSFMLQNLGKPVIFTGSQIPLREPYNDARKNLIMATIFASSDTISEVAIFFHDRLVRGCRATKVNTSKLRAFDSPNLLPLAEIGINIMENEHLFRPPPRGSFKINTDMDTRLITLRLGESHLRE
jgi:L-asparaginase